MSVIVVTIMTIPKILLIRRQHSLNYSVAQRPRHKLPKKKKKNENRQTSKQKKQTNTQTKDSMDPIEIFYAEDDRLVKTCNERENIRDLSTHIGEGQLSSVH